MILKDKTLEEFNVDPDTLKGSSGKKCVVKCDYCGSIETRVYGKIVRGRKNITKDACSSKECQSLKRKEVFVKKYGVEHPSQAKSVQEKRTQTNLDKYGVENPFQIEEVKEKIRQTNLGRYGVENIANSEEMKERRLREKSASTSTVMDPEEKRAAKQRGYAAMKLAMVNKYGTENPLQVPEIKQKYENTMMERHGVASGVETAIAKKNVKIALSDPQVPEKRRETCIEKYGVDNPSKVPEFVDKREETNLDRYGVRCSFQSEDVKDKIKETNLDRYGFEHPAQSKMVKDKTKQTNMKRYGVDNPSKSDEVKKKISDGNKILFEEIVDRCAKKEYVPMFSEGEYLNSRQILPFKCLKHDLEFTSQVFYISQSEDNQCPKCRVVGTSKGELEVGDFVSSIIDGVVRNDRSIIPPLELDIYVPSRKVAIEYNGLYWHSELFKERKYHLDKFKACKDAGIRLIQIFEDEWRDRRTVCENIISSKLGVLPVKLNARQCDMVFVEKNDKVNKARIKDFVDRNHLQGNTRFDTGFLLQTKEGNIVFVITFRKPFTKKRKGCLEIARVCSEHNTVIRGGFTRLMKHALVKIKEAGYKTLITYSDCRYSHGEAYENNGFEFLNHSGPDYFYTDMYIRHGRFKFRAQPGKPEKVVAEENGVWKIFGAGHFVWKLEL